MFNSTKLLTQVCVTGLLPIIIGMTFAEGANSTTLINDSFEDNFDDGIIDTNIYQAIGGAIIEENSGQLIIQMENDGDGLNIDVDNAFVEAEWTMMDYSFNNFSPGQGVIFEVIPNLSEPFFITTFFDEQSLENIESNTIGESLTSFGSQKNCVIRLFEDIGVPEYGPGMGVGGTPIVTIDLGKPCSEISPVPLIGRFRVDRTDTGWAYDWGTARGDTNKISDIVNKVLIPSIPIPVNDTIKQKKIRFITDTPKDPLFSISSFGAMPIHRTPEPSAMIGLLAVGGLGIASKLKKKSQ